MTNAFVKPVLLRDATIDQIGKRIIAESLKPGDRLPTEQEWSQQLGVSRLTVREALKSLAYLGVVRSAPKRGTTVGELDFGRVTKLLQYQFAVTELPREQLLITREVIECGAMPYIAQRIQADPELYERLYAYTTLPGITEDLDKYIEADIGFHTALMEASGIEPLIAISRLLQTFFKHYKRDIDDRGRWKTQGVKFHRQILHALRDGDVETARQVYRETFTTYQGGSENKDRDAPGGNA